MGKKDTENAVYVALISGAVGLLWDMLLNPCGKHWIPFFNSPSIDVACFISKGGLRLIPPIPPLGRGKGGSGRYKSRAGELSDLAKSRRDDGEGGNGLGIPFRPSGGDGDGGDSKPKREKRPRRDEPERSLEDILRGISQERGKDEERSSRRKSSETTRREEQQSLDDLIAQAGDIFSGGKVESFGEGVWNALQDIGKNAARTWEEWMNPKGGSILDELLRGKFPTQLPPIKVRYSEYYPYEYYQ